MIGSGEDNFNGYFDSEIEVIILMRESELLRYLLRLKKAEIIALVFELLYELRRLK